MRGLQEEDPEIQVMFQEAQDSTHSSFKIKGGALVKRVHSDLGEQLDLLLVPKSLRRKTLEEAHTNLLSGHFGYKKTKANLCRWLRISGSGRHSTCNARRAAT